MTHEQAEKTIRTHIECVIPLLPEIYNGLIPVGLKKWSNTLVEIEMLLQHCLNTLDSVQNKA